MPPFTVLRIQKLKTWGAIAGAAKHNQRERETPNADEAMRDGLRCLAAAGTRLYYCGLRNVARSTFADANNSRPVGFFQDLFGEMYALCAPHAPKHKFRFKSKLFSMDATTIKLCLSLFPWAAFRQKKGGVKMHTVLDHDGYIPTFVTVTWVMIY